MLLKEVMLRCPECNSTKLIKFGRKFTRDRQTDKRHLVQQYQCKSCGRITIKPRGDNKGK